MEESCKRLKDWLGGKSSLGWAALPEGNRRGRGSSHKPTGGCLGKGSFGPLTAFLCPRSPGEAPAEAGGQALLLSDSCLHCLVFLPFSWAPWLWWGACATSAGYHCWCLMAQISTSEDVGTIPLLSVIHSWQNLGRECSGDMSPLPSAFIFIKGVSEISSLSLYSHPFPSSSDLSS